MQICDVVCGNSHSFVQYQYAIKMIEHLHVHAQISRIRLLFLQAVLRQDMSWYDTSTGNNFAARITE